MTEEQEARHRLPPRRTPDEPDACQDAAQDAISSDELLRGGREVLIRHAGEIYRLRLTRNGKLILHK